MNNQGKKRTFFHSFRDAFRGIWDCLRSERNMRVHLVVCCYVVFFAFRMGLSRGELACLFLTIGVVMAAETMNTAVEKLCDFTEKRLSPKIRLVKDLAAGAVLLSALAAVFVGGAIFLRSELLQVLWAFCCQPVPLCLLALSAGAACVFIFAGPEGIRDFFENRGKKS